MLFKTESAAVIWYPQSTKRVDAFERIQGRFLNVMFSEKMVDILTLDFHMKIYSNAFPSIHFSPVCEFLKILFCTYYCITYMTAPRFSVCFRVILSDCSPTNRSSFICKHPVQTFKSFLH